MKYKSFLTIKKAGDWAISHPILFLSIALLPTIVRCIFSVYDLRLSDWWPSYYYFVGYETGFGGRKLLGTIIHLLIPGYVSVASLRPLLISVNLLMVALFIVLVDITNKKSPNNKLPILILAGIYLVSPFSLTTWIRESLFIFLESYMIVLVLAWLIVYIKWRDRWFYFLATLITALVCCLLHHTFCCLYFPLMVALFAYDSIDEDGIRWKRVIGYGLVCLSMLGLFVALWFFSSMDVDIDTLYTRIRMRAAPDACNWCKEALYYLFYISSSENRAVSFADKPAILVISNLGITTLLLLPLFLSFIIPFLIAQKRSTSYWGKLRYLLPIIIVIIMTLPIFFMATDNSRWWTAFCFCLAALLFAVIAAGDTMMSKALERLSQFSKKHWMVCLGVVIYLSQLHNLYYTGLSETRDIILFALSFLNIKS